VPKFSPEHKIKGVKHSFLGLSDRLKMFDYPSIKPSFANRKKIKQAIKNTDFVFIQELGPVGVWTQRFAQKFKKKIVHYVHNIPWEFVEKYFSFPGFFAKIVKWFFIHYYNKSDLLLVPYLNLKKELEDYGVKANIQVAKLGVDIEKFVPTKNKKNSKTKLGLPDKLIMGYVGRVSPEKNTLVLLEAMKKLDPQKYFLLMVGDGKKDIVNKFKEYKNCKVTGFVNNVKYYLQAMDFFIMPSLTETTSLATLEAMSCGLPVIVTKVGLVKDYVVKDYNGVFFPKANPTLLALKIEKLSRNIEIKEKLARNARRTVAYSFSWERSINKIRRVLFNLYYD
jgi:glycosyltransferase involved in cell wall biosynthesis